MAMTSTQEQQWQRWLGSLGAMESWGLSLPGSHLLIDVWGEGRGSFVVSVQKLLGLGDRKRGNRTITEFIQMSNTLELGRTLEQYLEQAAVAEHPPHEGPFATSRRTELSLRARMVCLRLFAIACEVSYFQRKQVLG
jgi:hypothetical protein